MKIRDNGTYFLLEMSRSFVWCFKAFCGLSRSNKALPIQECRLEIISSRLLMTLGLVSCTSFNVSSANFKLSLGRPSDKAEKNTSLKDTGFDSGYVQ